MPSFIVERGEAASFVIVALALAVCARVVARLAGAAPGRVEDIYWWGGIAFLVVGRLAHVALAAPELLLDPLVVIRFTDGLQPIAGAGAALAVGLWRTRGAAEPALWPATVVGLILAAAAYDLACPARGACFGAPAPAPFGFPMHGLTEPRLPTPPLEAAALLALLGVLLRLPDHWSAGRLGWAALAGLAAVRLASMPLSAAGVEVVTALTLSAVLLASAALAARAGGPRSVPAAEDDRPAHGASTS